MSEETISRELDLREVTFGLEGNVFVLWRLILQVSRGVVSALDRAGNEKTFNSIEELMGVLDRYAAHSVPPDDFLAGEGP